METIITFIHNVPDAIFYGYIGFCGFFGFTFGMFVMDSGGNPILYLIASLFLTIVFIILIPIAVLISPVAAVIGLIMLFCKNRDDYEI